MNDEAVTLTLTRAESLVLFEWLAKLESAETPLVEHPSEEKVLWKLEGQLESILEEPFARNYRELLAAARRQVEGDLEKDEKRGRDSIGK